MSESKHTPETALALARVAIFDRGIGWQADTTATLKALAAEVERLQTKREELRKSVAAIVGADEATWPDHGNVELAVAAHVAILQKAVEQKTSEVDRLREELERERGRVEDLCAENIDFRKTLEAEFGSHWEDVHDAVHRVEHKRHTEEIAAERRKAAEQGRIAVELFDGCKPAPNGC